LTVARRLIFDEHARAGSCPAGNAQTLIPGMSLRRTGTPKAGECASASGFFFRFCFCAVVFILVLRLVELTIDKYLESGDCFKVSGSAELAPQANFGQSLIFEAMCKTSSCGQFQDGRGKEHDC
jgi:hypothetical protein